MKTVAEIVKEVLKLAGDIELSKDSGLGNVPQWDSMGSVIILSEVEKEYGVEFTLDEMAEMNSIAKIEEVLICHEKLKS